MAVGPYRTLWRSGDESLSGDGHSITFARSDPDYSHDSTETTFYVRNAAERRALVYALAEALDVPL